MPKTDVREFRRNLRVMERLLDGWVNGQCCNEVGVSLGQCHALLAVEELGRPSLGELAGKLELDKSTVSRTVESLVRDQMLTREPSPEDRRVVLLSLSGKGEAACEAINARNDALFGRVFDRLGIRGAEVAQAFGELVRAMAGEESETTCCRSEEARK